MLNPLLSINEFESKTSWFDQKYNLCYSTISPAQQQKKCSFNGKLTAMWNM